MDGQSAKHLLLYNTLQVGQDVQESTLTEQVWQDLSQSKHSLFGVFIVIPFGHIVRH
jgi:hypothetical protein